jgi:hypothetical protein
MNHPYVVDRARSLTLFCTFYLGIDGEKAEVLLTSHFKQQDNADFTDSNVPPPPKVSGH